jgi:hypothetical protein
MAAAIACERGLYLEAAKPSFVEMKTVYNDLSIREPSPRA